MGTPDGRLPVGDGFLPFLLLLTMLPILVFHSCAPSGRLHCLDVISRTLHGNSVFAFAGRNVRCTSGPPLCF